MAWCGEILTYEATNHILMTSVCPTVGPHWTSGEASTVDRISDCKLSAVTAVRLRHIRSAGQNSPLTSRLPTERFQTAYRVSQVMSGQPAPHL